ncbi:oxidative stress-responsive serine-rich protein 1 [Cynoglossus semilaevis]|uniref:Oxidative stress-responsive serine-rich protein 1 n=1 Tax=Cynoglossus semilaevis TaxID=244447 RepID=A0A3P8V2N4_CYNSE|nr:oxidative stress-responsive serine-rich protein 1 [Cynoglossus semilaevis]XP_008318594.1 oxidative stress-responsive serine-rich protein 1 [Cynoglossus semilaevis]XP_024915727.1 oxidative stress-responsive serine-rich protein 1 [Cynoglossus semilaevis]
MEAGGKDCEEETLQTAFKKLRVDVECVTGAVNASEVLAPRVTQRPGLDASGAKPKLSCSKDNWHGCTRKTSRGAARSQRRRRSKSPILHPPKFTYCSAAPSSSLSTSIVCIKHQSLAVAKPEELCPLAVGRSASSAALSAENKLSSSVTVGNICPVVFGSSGCSETLVGGMTSKPSQQEVATAISPVAGHDSTISGSVRSSKEGDLEKSICGLGATSGTPQKIGSTEAADFKALSELHCSTNATQTPCCCPKQRSTCYSQEAKIPSSESQCECQSGHHGWQGMEVYSFTGLRNVISECEHSLQSHSDASRTHNANTVSSASSSPLVSGSPRSCSEQARSYVDDITIEDLSGYMEYYLYIPKKMSHMAEMMYT